MKYYSQLGQDKFIDEFFKNKENGVFIDVGAHDGETGSNTLFLEEKRNWKGICIEPGIEEFSNLVKKRNCIKINACISNYEGFSEFTYIQGYSNMLSGLTESYNQHHKNRISQEINHYGGNVQKILMQVLTLQSLIEKYSLYEIDYCSIDTEGSELNILQSIDFEKSKIKVFSVENNYQDDRIFDFMKSKGYILYAKLQWDDIYVK